MAMRSVLHYRRAEQIAAAISRSAPRRNMGYMPCDTCRQGRGIASTRVHRQEYGTGSSVNAFAAISTAVVATASLWHVQNRETPTGTSSLDTRSFLTPERAIERKPTRIELEDKYNIEWRTVLGEGSYGSVHPASLKTTGEKVALKRISKRSTDLSLFQSEADALRRINEHGGHPNVCALQDVYEDQHDFYLIMEFIAGGEMFEHLIETGVYAEADASRLMKDFASALAFLHRIGIVHSDVKPENILLSSKRRKDGKIKVIDFGCAFLDHSSSQIGNGMKTNYSIPEEQGKTRRTENSGTTGTTAYWSPERFVDGAVANAASDMWSVGIILFIMLTGVHPFDVEETLTDSEIAEAIKADAKPSSEISSHLSPAALDLIQKLMTKDPSRRMTAEEMLQHPWIQGGCFPIQ